MAEKEVSRRKTQRKKKQAERLCNWKECDEKVTGRRQACDGCRSKVSRAAKAGEWSKIRRPEGFKKRQQKKK